MTLHRNRHFVFECNNCQCGPLDWNVIFQISALANKPKTFIIWGFCHEVDENWALLVYYHFSLRNNPEKRSSQPENFHIFAIFFFLFFLLFLISSPPLFLTSLCASRVRLWRWSFFFFWIEQEVTHVKIYDYPPIYFRYEYSGLNIVVSCECELIPLCYGALFLFIAVHKTDLSLL